MNGLASSIKRAKKLISKIESFEDITWRELDDEEKIEVNNLKKELFNLINNI